MESQNQKWVNLSYLSLSILAGYIFFTLALKIIGTYDLEAQLRNIDLYVRMGSIGFSAVLFIVLYRNDSATQFMHEVVAELGRVTWPTQKETTSATFIVVIMVLISGLILGFLDYLWTYVLRSIL